MKQTIWFEGIRNAWVIQAVNCKEMMKALPKILRYFTSKVWCFPFISCTKDENKYKALKREETTHRKAIDIAIEEFVSIDKSLDSSEDEKPTLFMKYRIDAFK